MVTIFPLHQLCVEIYLIAIRRTIGGHCIFNGPHISKKYTINFVLIGGSESHLSGCFQLFAPKFWEVVEPYECYFITQ